MSQSLFVLHSLWEKKNIYHPSLNKNQNPQWIQERDACGVSPKTSLANVRWSKGRAMQITWAEAAASWNIWRSPARTPGMTRGYGKEETLNNEPMCVTRNKCMVVYIHVVTGVVNIAGIVMVDVHQVPAWWAVTAIFQSAFFISLIFNHGPKCAAAAAAFMFTSSRRRRGEKKQFWSRCIYWNGDG